MEYELKKGLEEFERPLIPDGLYELVVTQIHLDLPDGKFGKRIRFIYQTKVGEKNVELARTGYANFTSKTKIGKDCIAMGIPEGTKFNTDDLVGKKVKAFVKQTEIEKDGKKVKQSIITDILKA